MEQHDCACVHVKPGARARARMWSGTRAYVHDVFVVCVWCLCVTRVRVPFNVWNAVPSRTGDRDLLRFQALRRLSFPGACSAEFRSWRCRLYLLTVGGHSGGGGSRQLSYALHGAFQTVSVWRALEDRFPF